VGRSGGGGDVSKKQSLIYQVVCPVCKTKFETRSAVPIEKLHITKKMMTYYKKTTGVDANKIVLCLKDACPLCHPAFTIKHLNGVEPDVPEIDLMTNKARLKT
jgi:ribosomal protein L31